MENTTSPSQMAQQPRKSSTMKIVLIVVVILVLLFIGGGILIYGVGKKVLSESGVDIKKDGISVKNEDGSTSTFGKSELPADWPADLPQYPGSTIAYSGTNTDEGGKISSGVVLSTDDSAEAVIAHYKKELVAKGWKNTATNSANGASSLAFEKDTRQAVVVAGTSEGKTVIALSVTSK